MLQLKHVCKQYKTGTLIQKALDDASLNLRENEFVAILGPSGSGKTTLLNIIGGLDRYDSGDLVINNISTKKYKDRDWDSYRNHTIGFVFQSYNLIPHQTVLANVELALTISGVSKAERRKRAKMTLEQVGLEQQLHKKPGQMSGGQMQRVAIARALVNDPEILLADEPTGALDSETSVQVMELLKEVARDRLVVMVTHNPELAEEYATRIVKLKDGRIYSDSAPYAIERNLPAPVHKNMGKASMSFLTALTLSFNNLRTKKVRTLLTSFAGSIGIIGIALILALSNGVNSYIKSVEESTMSEYPLEIQSSGFDIASMMLGADDGKTEKNSGEVRVSQWITSMLSKVEPNDLEALKAYLDSGKSGIEPYAKAIEYTYDIAPQIYRMEEGTVRQVHPDQSFSLLGLGASASASSLMSSMMNTDVFHEMPENTNLYQEQYEVRAGHWPTQYNECVVVLTSGGTISDFMLYTLGLRDSLELDDMIKRFLAEEEVKTPDDIRTYSYDEFLGITFKLVNGASYYEYDDTYDVWVNKQEDNSFLRNLVRQGEDITIVGVVQPSSDADAAMLSSGIGYPASLTKYVIEQAKISPIVQEQMAQPGINVLTGKPFGDDDQNSFDMSSLFSINEDALQEAFGFDTNVLDIDLSDYFNMNNGSLNLEDMVDWDDLALDLPEFSGIDMADIFGQIDFFISTDGMEQLGRNVLAGYEDYAAVHPEADYSRLNENFMEYLQSPEAEQILQDRIDQVIQSNVDVSVSPEQLEALVQDIMLGNQEYATNNQLTDLQRFNEYFLMYLQTPEAQQKIVNGAAGIVTVGGVEIAPDELEAIVKDIVQGYQDYVTVNALPDPNRMGEYFTAYLQTSEAEALFNAGFSEIINVDALQTQLSSVLDSSMKPAMGSYIGAVTQTIQSQVSAVMKQVLAQVRSTMQDMMQTTMQSAVKQIGASMENAFTFDYEAFMNAIEIGMDENELTELLNSLITAEDASYQNNLKKFGYADLGSPGQIDIYPLDFESKAGILKILDAYNDRMMAEGKEDKVLSYTDLVGTLMSSVTEIIDTISYVLIAFVAISLVVSSIMIGVITYISVLERKKEIGILRAIGASKGNISQVFNAETFIIGLCAGLIGIGLTLLLLIPGNMLIHSLAGRSDINASLPVVYGVILILLSVILTLIGGLIPSRKAAKSDPVAALRTE